MTDFRDGAIVVTLIEALNERDSFCGETHVQKGAYFLKELASVQLDSVFALYLYGPYSFDLHKLLNELHSEDVVKLEPRSMGASWRLSERYPLLKRRFTRIIDAHRRQVDFVADRIARLGVMELERYGTALLVTKRSPGGSLVDRAEQLTKLKKHITLKEAESAIRVIDGWIEEAEKAQLAP